MKMYNFIVFLSIFFTSQLYATPVVSKTTTNKGNVIIKEVGSSSQSQVNYNKNTKTGTSNSVIMYKGKAVLGSGTIKDGKWKRDLSTLQGGQKKTVSTIKNGTIIKFSKTNKKASITTINKNSGIHKKSKILK